MNFKLQLLVERARLFQ